MRILSLVICLAACASSPDPRRRTLENVQRDGRGGWIVVERTGKPDVQGELIAMAGDAIDVLDVGQQLVVVPRAEITAARVWAWPTSADGVLVWGGAGAVGSASNGFFALFTLPAWLATTAITAAYESRAALYRYPDDGWEPLAIWARFPQGLPEGVDAHQLTHQHSL